LTRLLWRVVDPLFYLKAVIGVAGLGLFVLPFGVDLTNAALKRVNSDEGTCRIVAVVDGDTVTLTCPESGVGRARLLGLDAPEKFSPQCATELIAAERSTWALRSMILKATTLELVHDGTDRYGRALVRLDIDGEDVARRMIREGHARAYGGGLRGSWC
jgi:micrococcal nuclease